MSEELRARHAIIVGLTLAVASATIAVFGAVHTSNRIADIRVELAALDTMNLDPDHRAEVRSNIA